MAGSGEKRLQQPGDKPLRPPAAVFRRQPDGDAARAKEVEGHEVPTRPRPEQEQRAPALADELLHQEGKDGDPDPPGHHHLKTGRPGSVPPSSGDGSRFLCRESEAVPQRPEGLESRADRLAGEVPGPFAYDLVEDLQEPPAAGEDTVDAHGASQERFEPLPAEAERGPGERPSSEVPEPVGGATVSSASRGG